MIRFYSLSGLYYMSNSLYPWIQQHRGLCQLYPKSATAISITTIDHGVVKGTLWFILQVVTQIFELVIVQSTDKILSQSIYNCQHLLMLILFLSSIIFKASQAEWPSHMVYVIVRLHIAQSSLFELYMRGGHLSQVV